MTEFAAPPIDVPVLKAEHVSKILGRSRPTVTGWVNRYPWLGIAPVEPGTARRFTFRELGVLVALRGVLWGQGAPDGLEHTLPRVIEEIERDYAALFEGGPIVNPDGSGHFRYADYPDGHRMLQLYTVGVGEEGGGFYPRRASSNGGAALRDLCGFAVPQIILFFGQDLRHAWNRALLLLQGYELDD